MNLAELPIDVIENILCSFLNVTDIYYLSQVCRLGSITSKKKMEQIYYVFHMNTLFESSNIDVDIVMVVFEKNKHLIYEKFEIMRNIIDLLFRVKYNKNDWTLYFSAFDGNEPYIDKTLQIRDLQYNQNYNSMIMNTMNIAAKTNNVVILKKMSEYFSCCLQWNPSMCLYETTCYAAHNLEMIKYLVSKFNIRVVLSALRRAIQNNYVDVVDYLVNHCRTRCTLRYSDDLVRDNNFDSLKILLDKLRIIRQNNEYLNMAIETAEKKQYHETAQLLKLYRNTI